MPRTEDEILDIGQEEDYQKQVKEHTEHCTVDEPCELCKTNNT